MGLGFEPKQYSWFSSPYNLSTPLPVTAPSIGTVPWDEEDPRVKAPPRKKCWSWLGLPDFLGQIQDAQLHLNFSQTAINILL